MKQGALKSLGLAIVLAGLAGCHKQVAFVNPPAPTSVQATALAAPPVSYPAAVPVSESSSRGIPDAATRARIQELLDRIQDVYFGYDRHALRPDAQATLQADATTPREILNGYPGYKLTVEGFCDERGSDAYNTALGDLRAKKAETFLETLGVPSSHLRTLSFGKEKPVCTEHTESCWQKNRRAHITQDQLAG
jgi:peptidoglycan-associated lipoprotein